MNKNKIFGFKILLVIFFSSIASFANAEIKHFGTLYGSWQISDDGQTWNAWTPTQSNRNNVDVWEARQLFNIPQSQRTEVVIKSLGSDDRAAVAINADPNTNYRGNLIPGATQVIFNGAGLGSQWFDTGAGPSIQDPNVVYKNWATDSKPAYITSNGLQNVTAFVNNTGVGGNAGLNSPPTTSGGPSNVGMDGVIITGHGPISPYYLTAGDQRINSIVQNENVIKQEPQDKINESAIAVIANSENVMRTLGNTNPEMGSEYSLETLKPTPGTSYPYPQVTPTANFLDGTSDVQFGGAHNYSVDNLSGKVYKFDEDWANPISLFDTGFGENNALGITYDPQDKSLWVSEYKGSQDNSIFEFDLLGKKLKNFSTNLSYITALGMDYVDGTLWMGSLDTSGTYYQYARDGASLDTVAYGKLVGTTTLGGEFRTCEPIENCIPPDNVPEIDSTSAGSALTLLMSSLGLLAERRRNPRADLMA